jgi:hypothetical protein
MDILPDTLLECESKLHTANAGTKGSKDKMEVALQKGVFLHSFRTRLCKYYSSNSPCAHGERCQFAHGVAELRAEAAISMVSYVLERNVKDGAVMFNLLRMPSRVAEKKWLT